MPTALEIYREFAARPQRSLSVSELEDRGMKRNHAHTVLSRLRASGLAYSDGSGRVKLLLADEAAPVRTPEDPVVREMTRKGAKATGFTVLPRRYPGPRPREFIAPPGKVQMLARTVKSQHPELVVATEYRADDRAVCIYPARVRGEKASVEEALVHVFRHAPRADFALALQAVLMTSTDLNWRWLQRQQEWPEFAGVFAAVNEIAGRDVVPRFKNAEPPSLTYNELETIAQPFVARRGASRGNA